jgi:DNA-binding XRE family transcriptional regulator
MPNTQKKVERLTVALIRHLKSARVEKNISHQALAEKVGVSRPAISHVENGKRCPSLLLALKMAYALSLDIPEILKQLEKELGLK